MFKDDVKKYLTIKEGCASKKKGKKLFSVDDETGKDIKGKLYVSSDVAPEATKQKVLDMSDGAKEVGKRSPLSGYPSFSTSATPRVSGKMKSSYSKDAQKYAKIISGDDLFSPIKKNHVSLAAEYSKAEGLGGKEGIAAMSKLKKKFYSYIKK